MSGARGAASWRGLGVFWLVVLLAAGSIGGVLQVLGPPTKARPEPVPATPTAAPIQSAPVAPVPTPAAPPGQVAAPIAALLEPSRLNPPAMLPRVATDGRMARQVYARSVDAADKRPRVGLILAGLGLSDADSRNAIATAPGAVTLAFSAYATNPDALLDAARKAGHEVLAAIPMESNGFPTVDAGTRALMTGATIQDNQRNLDWSLSRLQGYVGATAASDQVRGERFSETTGSIVPVLEELNRRGLLYVDPRPGRTLPAPRGLPLRTVDIVVDESPARADIQAKLLQLEQVAREKGSALGLASPPRSLTVERIAEWAKGLEERGFVLVPVSALAVPPPGAPPH